MEAQQTINREETQLAYWRKGSPMRRYVVLLLTLTAVSACATSLTRGRPDYQQLLVTQRFDAAYIRVQHVAVALGLQIASTQDPAYIFTAKRPTGEQVTVTIAPLGVREPHHICGDAPARCDGCLCAPISIVVRRGPVEAFEQEPDGSE